MMFITESEKHLINDYEKNGYLIKPASDFSSYEWIREQFKRIILRRYPEFSGIAFDELLNNLHKKIAYDDLNNLRLHVIEEINGIKEFRFHYYMLAKTYLDVIVGNELAMQRRVNLSIQLPNDNSSLLDIHADTWSGDSPFEVVVWVPLVDCYGTKAMYFLQPEHQKYLADNLINYRGKASGDIFELVKDKVTWMEVKSGEVLIFNQALAHGNRINAEIETRWSMNCRFKGIFSPYSDKKLGEFFEPISLRPASKFGLNYMLPKVGY